MAHRARRRPPRRWGALPAPTLLVAGLLVSVVGCDRPEPRPKGTATSDPVPAGAQPVAIEVSADGFRPAEAHVTQGKPGVLTFTRVVESGCVDAVKMPWREEPYELPLNQPVNIVIPDTSKAGRFAYTCWMDMVRGEVVVDPAPSP